MDINLPRETRLHMLRIENNKKLVEVAKDIGISAASARGKSADSHGPRKKRGLNKNRDGMPG